MAANPGTILRITAHSTPDNSDPPDAHTFYAALGMLSVAWGRLEGHAIGNVLTIINLLGRGHEKITLFPWDRLVELWNEGFSSLQPLKAHETRAAAFIQSVKDAAAADRNFAAHTIWEEFDRHAPEPTMTARYIKARKGSPGMIDLTIGVSRCRWSMLRSRNATSLILR
jgi:hypothetical protein